MHYIALHPIKLFLLVVEAADDDEPTTNCGDAFSAPFVLLGATLVRMR